MDLLLFGLPMELDKLQIKMLAPSTELLILPVRVTGVWQGRVPVEALVAAALVDEGFRLKRQKFVPSSRPSFPG